MKNHKFQYKVIKSGARAYDYEPSLDWLKAAGIINKCVLAKEGKLPHNKISFVQVHSGIMQRQRGHSFIRLAYQSANIFFAKLEDSAEITAIFERDFDTERIIRELSAKSGQSIFHEDTLIIYMQNDMSIFIFPIKIILKFHLTCV